MKKYLFGIFAIAVAIAFSAFTPESNQGTTTERYWYELTYDIDGVSNPRIESQSPVFAEKEEIETGCQDTHTTLDCFRGFDVPLSSFPSTLGGDEQIKKTAE